MVNILSLTGGGYRGLYTARLLERMEQKCGQPVGRSFDLIAGTSIGGILALATAFEVPMSDVVRRFESHGSKIFPSWRRFTGLFRSRYSFASVGALVDELFPAGATLADAKHALAIPTLNLTLGKGQILKTRHKAEWERDQGLTVRQVAMATSAAPIYFPIAEIGNNLFCDGGLFANAPDLVALHEANMFFNASDKDVQMLSIGTMADVAVTRHGVGLRRGVLSWLAIPKLPLIQTILSTQEQMALQIVSHRLSDRYLRIDSKPGQEMHDVIGLDRAGEAARRTLLASADQSFDALDREKLDQFLLHIPIKWLK